MSAPVIGVGFLLVSDVLTDVSYALIEPPVNTAFPAPVTAGVQTVAVFHPSMYVGAQVVCGLAGDPELEVVTITAVVVGTSFTATFTNPHAASDSITGATFPVRNPTDPFFTQDEMLGYLASAVNDFLSDCPLAVTVTGLTVPPTAQTIPLPADCQKPVRLSAYQKPLRETSQSELDIFDYRWQQNAASGPYAYFRDKVGLQKVGIWPRANNTTPLEVVYEQRGLETYGLADGFLFPDPFVMIVKARVLEFAYSKDGEQRNPGLSKFWNQRYAMGLKLANIFLEVINDPNLEMAEAQ